jgi:hypothetical protein
MRTRSCLPRATLGLVGVGLIGVAALGCQIDSADDLGATEDQLTSTNGLTMINGLTMTNGLGTGNGLTMINGLTMTNGLASSTGLMTSAAGRITVAYLVRCALPSGHSISKKDQNGTSYTFAGAIGVAPAWENGACDTTCQEAVSACMMAHINVAGVHVPLWLDSPIPAIGYGSSSSYPNEEGTFFGNIFVTNSNGKVPAYYCEGSGFASGVVPGRLGATAAGIFTNPFGSGAQCAAKCTAAPSSYKGQGYAACNGYKSPITVWRASSYRPVFDSSYYYRLVNSQSKLGLEISGASTADGAPLVQNTASTTKTNQMFRVVLTASSTWTIVAVNSGKEVVATGSTDGSPVKQKTSFATGADLWAIDDHNGHFKVISKWTADAMEVPSGNKATSAQVQTSAYLGTSNQDWDIFAVVP